MSFRGFSIVSSGGHYVQRIEAIKAILVEGHPRNFSVNYFKQEGPEALNPSPEYTGQRSNII